MATSLRLMSSTAPAAPAAATASCSQRRGTALPLRARRAATVVAASSQEEALTGVVFESLKLGDVKNKLVTQGERQSLARSHYNEECEAAINDQINMEYNISYIYHSLFAYFDRDDVALPGFAAYFKAGSDEEREHAEGLMKFQALRGGRVKLQSIVLPEFNPMAENPKGDALVAMELALALEKLNYEKLLALHAAADSCVDPQMTDFVEGFLDEQVDAINDVAKKVAQLRSIGLDGYGVWAFDKALTGEMNAK